VLAADGWLDAQEQVGLAQAVLIPRVGEMIAPRLSEVSFGDLRANLSQFRQPDQLQVQVIIGDGAFGHRVVKGQGKRPRLSLVGLAQGAAHVLAQPAAEDLAAVCLATDRVRRHVRAS